MRGISGLIAPLVCGLIFGTGLLVSGMVQPTKVLGFLDIFGAWDPSLAVVMAAALAVAVPGYYAGDEPSAAGACRAIFLAGQIGDRCAAGAGGRAVRNRMGARRTMPRAGAREPGDVVAGRDCLRCSYGRRDAGS